MTLKEPNRRVSTKVWCPFCDKRENKLLPVEQVERLHDIVHKTVMENDALPVQCFECIEKEKKQ